jgi:KUP system potassium uptake protein
LNDRRIDEVRGLHHACAQPRRRRDHGADALLHRNKVAHGTVLVTLGIFGAALFFGDGIITPAISVLGSIQGVQVATPALAHVIVPLSVVILLGLFLLQRFGSGTIGWCSGR